MESVLSFKINDKVKLKNNNIEMVVKKAINNESTPCNADVLCTWKVDKISQEKWFKSDDLINLSSLKRGY